MDNQFQDERPGSGPGESVGSERFWDGHERTAGDVSGDALGQEESPAAQPEFDGSVIEAVREADQAARQAGRQVMVSAYERNRLVAIGALDAAIARAHLAAVGMKWDSESYPDILENVLQAERAIQAARAAINARLQLADIECRVMASRGETAPAT